VQLVLYEGAEAYVSVRSGVVSSESKKKEVS